MYADGGIIDPVLLMSGLRNQEAFEEVGGARYVAELIDDLPMLSSFEQYCKSVRDKADYRKVIADAERVTMEAYEATEPATALAGKLADSANEILDRANTSSTSRSWGEVAAATMAIIEERYNGDHGTPGFPWPLRDLNELTNGIQKKKVTVIAARPGDGKTAFAGQVINHLASNGVSCGVCSTEMPAEDLMMRNFAAASGISSMKLERGLIGKTEFPILEKTADKVARLPIQVDDRASPTIEEIEVIARTWKRDHDLQVLAVDYLQILQGAKDSWSKEDKVSRLMAGLLRIAKKLDIAIILLRLSS
jgi:replicative DNA helicase